jgi:hypothetical protein
MKSTILVGAALLFCGLAQAQGSYCSFDRSGIVVRCGWNTSSECLRSINGLVPGGFCQARNDQSGYARPKTFGLPTVQYCARFNGKEVCGFESNRDCAQALNKAGVPGYCTTKGL